VARLVSREYLSVCPLCHVVVQVVQDRHLTQDQAVLAELEV
jgi:hypothetical protein